MSELKFNPVTHDHTAFIEKAEQRNGFKKAYDDLEEEYASARNALQKKSILEGLKEIRAGQTTPHETVLAKLEAKAGE